MIYVMFNVLKYIEHSIIYMNKIHVKYNETRANISLNVFTIIKLSLFKIDFHHSDLNIKKQSI